MRHTVTERPDGGLDVTYTPPMSGEYRITLAVGPSPVAGSPFRVPCQLPRACEACSELDLQGGYGFVGEVYTARLVCNDQSGNPWTGRVEVMANVMDGNEVLCEAQVTEVCPGQFDISFYPEISATYGLAVMLDGRALQGSPFKIRVKADETIPSKCKVYGSQLVHGTAGATMTFHIQAMDAKNNARLAGGDAFAVEIVGPEEPRPTAAVKDNGNGYWFRTLPTSNHTCLCQDLRRDVVDSAGGGLPLEDDPGRQHGGARTRQLHRVGRSPARSPLHRHRRRHQARTRRGASRVCDHGCGSVRQYEGGGGRHVCRADPQRGVKRQRGAVDRARGGPG